MKFGWIRVCLKEPKKHLVVLVDRLADRQKPRRLATEGRGLRGEYLAVAKTNIGGMSQSGFGRSAKQTVSICQSERISVLSTEHFVEAA